LIIAQSEIEKVLTLVIMSFDKRVDLEEEIKETLHRCSKLSKKTYQQKK
jgi:hypothetical protein